MSGTALADFLAREEAGSPIEARELRRPANGPAGVDMAGAQAVDVYPRDIEEQHARIVRWFEEAERASDGARRLAEQCRDYYGGDQWTQAEREALKKRGQPELTINYVRRKVDLLCGMERKARTDPKAFPRTPNEDQRADAATQALRFVSDDVQLPAIRSAVYENMIVEGYGGAEIGLEDDGQGGATITVSYVGWERLWHDPHSRAADFSDARYLGLVLWMDRDQLEELYPGAGDVVSDSFAVHPGTYEDRPGNITWSDNRRERVRVVQCWWVEGGIWWGATVSRSGFLAQPQPSPLLDRRGRSACPLVLQSAYVDRDNRRYGAVRDLLSLQDEINKRRSKALHLLSVNRTIAEKGAVDDVDAARREVAKPDGYIEVMPGMRFEVAPAGELAAGQFKLLQHATEEMQASGPNASMAGNDPRDLSGRAILAQQAGGAAQNEPLADSLRQWTRRVYETCWMAVRQYWGGERWVRVTDDFGAVQWVGLNRQVTLRDELAAMDEAQRAQVMQGMQLQPGDPRLMQVLRVENDLAGLEVDITIEEGPDVPALQAEQFGMLAQLAQSMPGVIPPDVLIAASNLRNKGEILQRMQAAQAAQAQQQERVAPLLEAEKQAEVRGKNAEAAADEALAAERAQRAVVQVAQVHQMAAQNPAVPIGPPDVPSLPA